jgi:hypothetical protein
MFSLMPDLYHPRADQIFNDLIAEPEADKSEVLFFDQLGSELPLLKQELSQNEVQYYFYKKSDKALENVFQGVIDADIQVSEDLYEIFVIRNIRKLKLSDFLKIFLDTSVPNVLIGGDETFF